MAKKVKKITKKTVKSSNKTVKTVAKTANTITVKNAEGDPDTTATILIQNKINYTPKISVIIPVYNVEQYLRECLDSVCNQTLREIEIICVDDGSTDSSLEILKEYAARDPRITIITQENLHAGVARNAGLAVAKGGYLSFLDSDDFFEPNMLKDAYTKAAKEKSDIVMFDCYLYDNATKTDKEVDWTLDINGVPKAFSYKDIPERIFKLSNCWVWNRLYNHKFITDNKLYFQNTAFSNDVYFSCAAMALAKKIVTLNKRYAHYRTNQQHDLNVTGNQNRIKHPTASLECFKLLYDTLNKHRIYNKVRNSFLVICVENLYWTMNCLLQDDNAYNTFTEFLAKNYKEILSEQRVELPISEDNRKYIVLRNILVDAGVFHEIPKRVFYVWGANEPIRPEVQKCIDTWKKFLPDYDIVQIDDDSTHYFNFQQELKENKWFRTVFERKMWAYVADYIRMKTLYAHGGIYFDTDVSVVQNMDKFLKEPAFIGMQRSSQDSTGGDWVEPAIFGTQKQNKFIGMVSCFYDELIWKEPIYTMPQIFNYYLRRYDIFPFPPKAKQKIIKLPDLTIYPERYFIPYRWNTEFKPECIESDTHTIHHWGGSWTKPNVIKFLSGKHTKLSACDAIQPVKLTSTTTSQQYEDENGNFVKIPSNKKITINMYGKNNTIIMDSGIDANQPVAVSVAGNNNLIIMGPNSSELCLFCGFRCNRYTNNAMFVMGKNNSSRKLDCFLEENNTSIVIGDDNLFSWGIELRCSDSHTMLDLENNVLNRSKSINIGNHNWICKDTLFLKNSAIANDSVVGCRSLVTRKITDSNVLITGSPAKIVKENITWNGRKPDVYGTGIIMNEQPKETAPKNSTCQTVALSKSAPVVLTPEQTTPGNTMPKISVIIPVYNVERYLPQCLDSVINQTLHDIEIICVNDGSPDNSLQILQEYAKKDKRIVIINQQNQGLSCSRNNALNIARGEYILFLDSDDWIRNDACELLYSDAKSGDLDMLNFAGTNYNQDTKQYKAYESQTMKYINGNGSVFTREQMQEFMYRIPISACRFFYRREFLEEHNMRFPEGINFEDNYFVRRALIFVQKYGCERETLYFRRVHNGSITQNVNKHFADYIEVVRRVDEMYSEYHMEKIAKPIIRDYLNMLYKQYTSMTYWTRSPFRNALFGLFVTAQRKYHFNDTNYNLIQFMRQELTCWYSQFYKSFDFDNPKTFNEKIQWSKLYDSTPIKTRLADKYLVRDWIADKIGDKYLIPLLGVYDSFDEINFDKLPKQFVIKTNHGSATNIIVKDKSELDIQDAREKLSKWMGFNYAFHSFELQYFDIKPKIIIEKYMDDGTGDLQDYKVMCFNGKPEFIWVDSDRHSDHKRNFFDLDWNEMDIKMNPSYGKKKNIPAPKTLKEMIDIAKKLSVGFNMVRVDFYEIQGRLYFGEMTFTSSSGAEQIVPESFGIHLGKLFKLPERAYDICTGEYYKIPKARKVRKSRTIKPYLLLPYYEFANMWMKVWKLPVLKCKKHIKSVLYAHSHRGKMDMLNANFDKILQSILTVRNGLQWQINTVKNQQSELVKQINNMTNNTKSQIDAGFLETQNRADNLEQALGAVKEQITEQQKLFDVKHSETNDKLFDMKNEFISDINKLSKNISDITAKQTADNKHIEGAVADVKNQIQTLEKTSDGIIKKLDSDKAELNKNIEQDRVLYFNPFSTGVNTERGNCDIADAPNFENRFKKLISGLSPNDAATIVKIIRRLQLIKGTNYKLDLFTTEEKALLQRVREFNREILKVSDNLYAYKNYLLPINHFEPSVFFYNHGIERLDSVESFKHKDILDVGGFIGDSVLMLSPFTDKKIYSFEATKENYDLMQQTIKLNNIKNAVPVHAAVGDKNGEIELRFNGSASSQNDMMVKNPKYIEKCPLIKIDDYVRKHNIDVGLIKVDIEGAEQSFLRGARETITKYKPTLLISIYHNVDDFLDIKPMIESWNLGYKFKIFKPVIESVSGETLLICEQ